MKHLSARSTGLARVFGASQSQPVPYVLLPACSPSATRHRTALAAMTAGAYSPCPAQAPRQPITFSPHVAHTIPLLAQTPRKPKLLGSPRLDHLHRDPGRGFSLRCRRVLGSKNPSPGWCPKSTTTSPHATTSAQSPAHPQQRTGA